MAQLAGSFYLVSTVAFCLFCLAIGVRLMLLSRRTGARPELLLGIGLFLTGGFGYGILIAVALIRQAMGDRTPAIVEPIGIVGKALHDLGVVAMLGFILTVFRPGERWAMAFVALMVAALAVGNVVNAATGGFREARPMGFWYWLGFATIGTQPLWASFEALRYHDLLRKRRALGIADPVVVNRVLLWGVASIFSAAAIWTISLPSMLFPLDDQMRTAPTAMLLTALWGIGAITSYWFAFFPPGWYLARLRIAEG